MQLDIFRSWRREHFWARGRSQLFPRGVTAMFSNDPKIAEQKRSTHKYILASATTSCFTQLVVV